MSQIAAASNGNCVARALSTMRLALGYPTGLPDNYQPPVGYGRKVPEIVAMLGDFFPGRRVYVGCLAASLPPDYPANVLYVGENFNIGPEPHPAFDVDACLLAFSYQPPGDDQTGHMVIGYPCTYPAEGMNMLLSLVIGVELEAINEPTEV